MSSSRALLTNLDINRNSSLIPFELQVRTRMVYGNDAIDQLGDLATGLGAKRVMVVTDRGLVEAGHASHGIAAL